MYMYVRTLGYNSEFGWQLAIIYFVLVMVIGNIILLALFTALLLKNFEEDRATKVVKAEPEEDEEDDLNVS